MARARLNIPGISTAPTPVGRAPARGQIGQEAYESIRTAILNCSFPPGMALSELAVSEELGVSKAPVRDAFRRLAGEGLLEVVPQRGTSVSAVPQNWRPRRRRPNATSSTSGSIGRWWPRTSGTSSGT
jgi:GntR family transcriptional regulator, rspAB operon transcriptional repressor